MPVSAGVSAVPIGMKWLAGRYDGTTFAKEIYVANEDASVNSIVQCYMNVGQQDCKEVCSHADSLIP